MQGPPSLRAPLERRLERVKGIEPSSVAWKATALPLSYTRAPAKLARAFAPAKLFSADGVARLSSRQSPSSNWLMKTTLWSAFTIAGFLGAARADLTITQQVEGA